MIFVRIGITLYFSVIHGPGKEVSNVDAKYVSVLENTVALFLDKIKKIVDVFFINVVRTITLKLPVRWGGDDELNRFVFILLIDRLSPDNFMCGYF